MTTDRYAVRVYQHPSIPGVWTWDCHCGDFVGWLFGLPRAHDDATRHAATCEALHRANLAAACPSCRRHGRIAPACPVCLGRGHIVEREGLS